MVSIGQRLIDEVVRVFRALGDNGEHCLVIGGVATFLYDFHERAEKTEVKTEYTTDIDLAIRDQRAFSSDGVEEKFKEIGFSPEASHSISSDIPLIKYSKQVDGEEIEIEFLVPLKGSEYSRSGKMKVVQRIGEGLTAQPLRFLDVLFSESLEISLAEISKDPKDAGIAIRLPHPGVYLMHKFITLHRRSKDEKKQKDAFYIYDVLMRFEGSWPWMIEGLKKAQASTKAREFRDFRDNFSDFFAGPTSEGMELIFGEYDRTYGGKFQLSREQVFAQIQQFIKLLG